MNIVGSQAIQQFISKWHASTLAFTSTGMRMDMYVHVLPSGKVSFILVSLLNFYGCAMYVEVRGHLVEVGSSFPCLGPRDRTQVIGLVKCLFLLSYLATPIACFLFYSFISETKDSFLLCSFLLCNEFQGDEVENSYGKAYQEGGREELPAAGPAEP